MVELAYRRIEVGAADKMHVLSSIVFLCLGSLEGVSAHVYAWYHKELQNKQWHEMNLMFVLSILGKEILDMWN